MKIVAIRVDASVKIGTGHVMRCLVLAELIRQAVSDIKIIFLCVRDDGDLVVHIRGLGYPVVEMKKHDDIVTVEQLAAHTSISISAITLTLIDLFIVDHYRLDATWERAMKALAGKILVIDDLANRVHDCDALLDQNFNQRMEERYKALVSESCRLFIGPKHLLLRPEFIQEREKMHSKCVSADGSFLQREIRNILIFYGGSDPTGETLKALKAVSLWKSRLYNQETQRNVRIHVIAGSSNPAFEEIREYCRSMQDVQVYQHVDNMAEMLMETDLVLGAGGVSMWERCYLGVPSIVTIVAENQRSTTECAAACGAIWNAGWYADVTVQDLAKLLERIDQDFSGRKRMSERAVLMMDEGIGEQGLLDWIIESLR